jgi:hypothetical protein
MDFLGDGLDIVIKCDPVPASFWTLFATWRSICVNLPFAKTLISTEKRDWNIPHWILQQKIRVVRGNFDKFLQGEKTIVISDHVLALRTYIDDKTVLAKQDEIATFVDYSICGGFNMKEWENEQFPFDKITRFHRENLSVNEIATFKFMKSIANLTRTALN